MKEHRRVLYNAMILDGTLWSHLAKVDKTCKERMDMLVFGMKETQGITEELKARDSMAWVGAMNNIRNAAEEILFAAVSYTHLCSTKSTPCRALPPFPCIPSSSPPAAFPIPG